MILKWKNLLSIAIIALAVGLFVTHNAGVIYAADEGLHVKAGNKVGIGTTFPGVKLDIECTSSADGIDINNAAQGNGDPQLRFQLSGTSIFSMGVDESDSSKFKVGTTAIETGTRLTIDSSGNVGIGITDPVEKMEVAGKVSATSFLFSSDRRLKKNIKPIAGLENILKLQGVSFDWRESGSTSIGLIAQDVEKVLPVLASTNPATGYKSIEYANLVAVLIEAVKEQQQQIDNQNSEIETLKGEVRSLINSL